MFLVAEVFHRLVIQQAVDGARVGAGIGFVHGPPEADAPLRHQHGVGDVDHHRGQRDLLSLLQVSDVKPDDL